MSFLTPLAFLFAMALPVVVVFYLLKRKRVVRLVSSTLLWQKFLAETQANAPFQRLRHNWLLLLQLLVLALTVLALARPLLLGDTRPTRVRVVILDGSASMQSTDVQPSRFEEARTEALRWVEGMGDGEQMMLLLAGATTEVRQSPTADKAALRRALQDCQPSDGPTRLADALKTAAAFTFEKRGEENVTTGEIHLISDGAAPDLEEVANQNLPLVYHRIGSDHDNAGITALDIKANPENPAERAIFVTVHNASTNEVITELELRFEDRLLEVRSLALAPIENESLVFLVPQSEEGVFHLRLTRPDQLAVDNEASIFSPLPRPSRALLVTRGNRFLEKALRGLPQVELTVQAGLLGEAREFDVVIFDDVSPVVWPLIHTLAIHVADTNWFASMSSETGPPIVDWRSTHPLLRYVNLDNVQIAEALVVSPPAWGEPLVESPSSPLIVAGEVDQRRLLWIGFDLLQSTWPLRLSFPIFMANAMQWLHPARDDAALYLVRAGAPWKLHLLDPVDQATVTLPSGQTRPLTLAAPTREIIFGETVQQGVYQLMAGTNLVRFCVNLLDPLESDIQPREELPLGRYETVAAAGSRRANLEIWRWFALAALGFLLFEWWFYHKRTV